MSKDYWDIVIGVGVSEEQNWTALSERLLEQALYELRSGHDAVPTASAALAALRSCDSTAAEQDELWEELTGVPVELPCTCPPDLVAFGGFRSTCLAHGRGSA
jgi:hypothetical protein